MISNFKTGKLTIESFINNGFYFNLRRELTINKFKKFEFRFDVMCDFSISNIYLNLNMPINAKNIQLDTLYFDSFIVEMDKFFDIQNIKSMFFLLEYKKHYFNIEEKLKEIEEKLKELFGIKNSSALLEELKKQYDSINKKIIMDQLKSFF